MDDAPPKTRNRALAIKIRNLRYGTPQRQLLDIENITITTGGPTLILGPNGSGKSIFLRAMHGLIAPAEGAVQYGSVQNAANIRQAMVFQRPVVLRRSVAGNLRYALVAARQHPHDRAAHVERLLSMAGLASKAHQQARSLSGGEQQLLSVVRAIAINPEVLFLDEPTSSLDPGITQLIEELIADTAARGTKVIMVSHNIGQARRLAEDILFLHDGRIEDHAPADQFFAAPGSRVAREFLARELAI
jgi:tungstate transport system ATP-binding protein